MFLHININYDDPYELSFVTYAINLINSVEAEEAFNLLDQKMREVSGMRYWGKDPIPPPKTQIENNRPFLLPRLPNKYDSSNIETTAYSLLVHIAKQDSFLYQYFNEFIRSLFTIFITN